MSYTLKRLYPFICSDKKGNEKLIWLNPNREGFV